MVENWKLLSQVWFLFFFSFQSLPALCLCCGHHFPREIHLDKNSAYLCGAAFLTIFYRTESFPNEVKHLATLKTPRSFGFFVYGMIHFKSLYQTAFSYGGLMPPGEVLVPKIPNLSSWAVSCRLGRWNSHPMESQAGLGFAECLKMILGRDSPRCPQLCPSIHPYPSSLRFLEWSSALLVAKEIP